MDAISPTEQLNEVKQSAGDKPNKILTFRYSLYRQFIVYLLIGLSVYIAAKSMDDLEVVKAYGLILLFLLIPLWFVSVVVKVNDSGIKISRWFGIYRQDIAWADLATIKLLAGGQRMLLTTAEGRRVIISSHIRNYSALVGILRKTRPALFETPNSEAAFQNNPSSGGIRTFQQNSIVKYITFFLGVICCLVALGTLIAQPLVGVVSVLFLLFLWWIQRNSAHTLTVQENKLIAKFILRQKEWTAGQIKDIRMHYAHNWYGIENNSIRIETIDGRTLRLAGFAGGDEMLYGFLKKWWNTYRSN